MMGELQLPALLATPGGVAGTIATALIVIPWLFRKFLLNDKVDAAAARGQVDVIQRLIETADRAERRASEAEARADLAYKERNEAYLKIGELTEQVRQLKQQVDSLQRTLDAKPTN